MKKVPRHIAYIVVFIMQQKGKIGAVTNVGYSHKGVWSTVTITP
jgi:predicted fused transcriptional regulator/phosphomethylpyrimidine kinase